MRTEGDGLRPMDNPINVHGLDNMDLGHPEERTMMEDHPVRVTSERSFDLKYLRRYRRIRLNRGLVDGFVNNYCFMMLNEENCFERGEYQKRVMRTMLTRQFLPWIHDNLIECLDQSRWPMRMDCFWVLDELLAHKFPGVHEGSCWGTIVQHYLRLRQMQVLTGKGDGPQWTVEKTM